MENNDWNPDGHNEVFDTTFEVQSIETIKDDY